MKQPRGKYPKSLRLLKRREFEEVSRRGFRRAGKYLFVELKRKSPTDETLPKLGITVTRKYGKSHDRNRFKRLVREAFRQIVHTEPFSFDLIVRPRKNGESLEMSLSAIVQDLHEIIFRPQ